MKKLSKSALIITIVTALLFAVAATALAASWGDSGDFKNRGGSGKYGATMNLTEDKATASLSISDYFGIVEEGGSASIVSVILVGNNRYDLESIKGTNIYRASIEFNIPEQAHIDFHCGFYFYEQLITQNALVLN